MKFYDTNALLKLQEKILNEHFYISSTSLQELEHIKVSRNKDEETKFAARKVLHILDNHPDDFTVIFSDAAVTLKIQSLGLEVTPDNQICACAASVNDVEFVTNDIACKAIAKHIFKLNVTSVNEDADDDYKGFIEKSISDDEMAYLYEHITENIYDLLPNQYLIISNSDNEIVDKFRWTGEEYANLKFPKIKSAIFGEVKPYCGDVYQQLALNSMSMNQVTMIKGAAGTGKSYLAIGYMMYLLERHKIDKIVMFANPTPTYNSAKIGFLPGTQLDKLIDSSVGNMLGSKLGDKFMIEQLVSQNKLSILPLCDIRGFDTSGLNCAVYITEAQNMDISLMKLALQRIGDDSICIIDGDYAAQVDLSTYAGSNNGMRRMSEVFRGQNFYGEVELQNIYRSRIAEIAERM